jgi:hypothetical protein
MLKKFRVAVAAAFLMLCAEPALAKHIVTADDAAQFKVGVATYANVAKLGKPTSISSNSDGERIIIYATVNARPKAATFIPIVGMFAGGATGETYMATFVFGPDGLLKRSNTTTSNIDCSMHVFSTGCQGFGAAPPSAEQPPLKQDSAAAPSPK